jgi:hypothetical protein
VFGFNQIFHIKLEAIKNMEIPEVVWQGNNESILELTLVGFWF